MIRMKEGSDIEQLAFDYKEARDLYAIDMDEAQDIMNEVVAVANEKGREFADLWYSVKEAVARDDAYAVIDCTTWDVDNLAKAAKREGVLDLAVTRAEHAKILEDNGFKVIGLGEVGEGRLEDGKKPVIVCSM